MQNLTIKYLSGIVGGGGHTVGVKEVQVDGCGDAEAAAEGASLANWKYDRFKTDRKPRPSLRPLDEATPDWSSGIR